MKRCGLPLAGARKWGIETEETGLITRSGHGERGLDAENAACGSRRPSERAGSGGRPAPAFQAATRRLSSSRCLRGRRSVLRSLSSFFCGGPAPRQLDRAAAFAAATPVSRQWVLRAWWPALGRECERERSPPLPLGEGRWRSLRVARAQ